MMMRNLSPTTWLKLAAATAILLPAGLAIAQTAPTAPPTATPAPAMPAPATPAKADPAAAVARQAATAAGEPNRALAYYHLALAATYEDDALSEGRPEDVTHAVEEYKLALNADPNSPELNDALADL